MTAPGYVYFIANDATCLVKIGYSMNVEARRAQLTASHGPLLRVLGARPGTRLDEKRLHARFVAHCTDDREWFRPAPEILALASEHAGSRRRRLLGGARDLIAMLRASGTTIPAFAESAGLDRISLMRVLKGERGPRIALDDAFAIQDVTGIPAERWRSETLAEVAADEVWRHPRDVRRAEKLARATTATSPT